MEYYTRQSFGFGDGPTPLVKKFLVIYGAIYVMELILEHWLGVPVAALLQLYPWSDPGFHFYQILTHPFIHDPMAPISFLIDLLVFYFFAAPLESVFGSVRFVIFFYLCALGSAICGLALGGISGLDYPFSGMTPSILAMVVVFGFWNAEATVLLFFVLPIKAKFISYGTLVVVGLTFLAKVNPFGAYHLGGILAGYLYYKFGPHSMDPTLMYLKFLQWRSDRKRRARFKVYSSSKNDDDSEPPTFH